MKKITKMITVITIAVIVAMVSMISTMAAVDKTTLKTGDVVEVAHYNVATGTYDSGTLKITNRTMGGGTYFILNETTFEANDKVVSDASKEKLMQITDAVNIVFNNRKDEVDLSIFGHVDSESAPYSVTIAPYAVPILESRGIDLSDNIWLAMGNKKGSVLDTYLTVSASDEYVAPTEPAGKTTAIKVITPKNMSIRLEDGTVLKSGDTFKAVIGKTYKFQMCSNNWDNNIYDDNGNGIAGTVVYSVKVANNYTDRGFDADTKTFTLPKGDKTLRTDVNNCFMAYKYHFSKGDYNKQTGIVNVVNTPLESLSVNLPLGSTIKSDAYKALSQIDTANVFIEQAGDKSLSYTDYYWNY